MRMLRRGFTLSLFAVLTAVPAARVQGAEPIRVGYLGSLSGIFAQVGKDMLDGLKLALEQSPCQAGGRAIQLVEKDTQGNPATAQSKYRKLVQQDKIATPIRPSRSSGPTSPGSSSSRRRTTATTLR